MPVKLIPHLRFLNPSLPVASFPSLRKNPSSLSSSRSISIFLRTFPFQTKTLDSLPCLNSQLTVCRFSTCRPLRSGSGSKPEFNRGGRDREPVSRSKSLVEDEAELNNWVSNLRTSSGFRGSFTSDDESDSGRPRAGRDRDRDRGERFPIKKMSREGFDSVPKRVRGEFRSNEVEDEGFGSRKRSGGNGRVMNGRRGGRERELGFKRDDNELRGKGRMIDDNVLEETLGSRPDRVNGRGLGLKRDGKGLRGSVKIEDDDEEEEEDVDDEDDERGGSMKGFGDLFSEEGSDDYDDDKEFEKKAASTMGLDAKDRTSSHVKSDTYLSETR